jgi:hypothetical protein
MADLALSLRGYGSAVPFDPATLKAIEEILQRIGGVADGLHALKDVLHLLLGAGASLVYRRARTALRHRSKQAQKKWPLANPLLCS